VFFTRPFLTSAAAVAFVVSLVIARHAGRRLIVRWQHDDRENWSAAYMRARRVQPFRSLIAGRITDMYLRRWFAATPGWAANDPAAKWLLRIYRWSSMAAAITFIIAMFSLLPS
jgi:hypothetical protein